MMVASCSPSGQRGATQGAQPGGQNATDQGGNKSQDDDGNSGQQDKQETGSAQKDSGDKDSGQQGGDDKGSKQDGGDDQKSKPKDPRAETRYPQRVTAGALRGRRLIEPEESQHVLGRIEGIVRDKNGDNQLVIDTGGWLSGLGIGKRLVTVAMGDAALLGRQVALIDLDPDKFEQLPTYRVGSMPAINPRETIRMGIVKPFH